MKTSDKKLTMKEIGRLAGVSQQAVSLVLNNKETSRVGKATREKVLRLVRELNYTPNLQAQSLVSGKTKAIAIAGTSNMRRMNLLLPSRIYSGIGGVALDRGYSLHFLPLNSDAPDRGMVSMVRGQMADGLIIVVYSPMEESFKNETAPLLLEAGIPFVAVTTTNNSMGCPQVGFNAFAGGNLAVSHLSDRNARSISVIGHCSRISGRQLFEGCRATAGSLGIILNEIDLKKEFRVDMAEFGYEAGKRIIAENGIDESYVIFSDAFANGFIDALEEAGKRVPDDVLVMGCEDLYTADILRSKLTAVNRKPEQTGKAAAEMLFDLLDGKNVGPDRMTVIEPELVFRKSTEKRVERTA